MVAPFFTLTSRIAYILSWSRSPSSASSLTKKIAPVHNYIKGIHSSTSTAVLSAS